MAYTPFTSISTRMNRDADFNKQIIKRSTCMKGALWRDSFWVAHLWLNTIIFNQEEMKKRQRIWGKGVVSSLFQNPFLSPFPLSISSLSLFRYGMPSGLEHPPPSVFPSLLHYWSIMLIKQIIYRSTRLERAICAAHLFITRMSPVILITVIDLIQTNRHASRRYNEKKHFPSKCKQKQTILYVLVALNKGFFRHALSTNPSLFVQKVVDKEMYPKI